MNLPSTFYLHLRLTNILPCTLHCITYRFLCPGFTPVFVGTLIVSSTQQYLDGLVYIALLAAHGDRALADCCVSRVRLEITLNLNRLVMIGCTQIEQAKKRSSANIESAKPHQLRRAGCLPHRSLFLCNSQ